MNQDPAGEELRPLLSVVVPVRDEEATLVDLYARMRDVLPADTEVILVDDGSRDGTAAVLDRLAAQDGGVVVLRFLRPQGKSAALQAGIRRSTGRFVATIDADLQEDPAEIARLLGFLEGAAAAPEADAATIGRAAPAAEGTAGGPLDLITGWRKRRRDPFAKVLASRVFNRAARLLSGVPLRDINCGLKVMRREVADAIQLEGGYHRFIPLLAHWRGFRVGEIEVGHRPRRHGRSRFGGERVLHGLIDLLVLVFLERFERRPSRLFLSCGAFLFAAGFGISAYLAWLRLATGSIQSRFPLLTFGVLLLVVGVQLVSTGLLAELVAHRHRSSQRAEPSVIEVAPRNRSDTTRRDVGSGVP